MKFVKRFAGVMTLAFLLMFGVSAKVNALETTENQQIQQNESQLSKWFDSELWLYVSQFGTAFCATVFALSSFIKSFKNVTSAFTKDTKEKEKLAAQITNDKNEILKSNENTIEMIKVNNEYVQKAIFEDNARTRSEVEKLLQAFCMVYVNNDKLVKSGVAAEIAKVLGDKNENTKA